MKVTRCTGVAVIALLCNCIAAKPMFGTAGMMRKKFPGTSDMSYNTYMKIAKNSGRPRETAPTFVGAAGTSSFDQQGNWLLDDSFSSSLDDDLTLRRGSSVPAQTFNRRPAVQTTQHVAPDYYPSSFVPRESFAHLYFPYYSTNYQKPVRHPYQPYAGHTFW